MRNIVFALCLVLLTLKGFADSKTHYRHGIELNPFYLLIITSGDNSETMLSGSYSYFDESRGVEYAFPFHVMDLKRDDYKQQTIDFHYRKFTDGTLGGFYLSGFARLAHLSGYAGSLYYADQTITKQSQVKFGLGAGLGYRYLSNGRFYWGTSLSLGNYLGKESDLSYTDASMIYTDANRFIFDIELFKFGWRF